MEFGNDGTGRQYRPVFLDRALVCFVVLMSYGLFCSTVTAQTSQPKVESNPAETKLVNPNAIPSGIAWYGILEDGLAEAKASNRPIILLSAAPQCAGVPGMW